MKSKIFTFFTFLFFTAAGVAQPLPESPLPDTITYHKFIRDIYTYNEDKLVKELTGYWYQPESAPYTRFGYRLRYIYNSEKKIKEIYSTWNENDPNGILRESFLYNKQGLDSLNVKYNYTFNSWTGDKLFNYEYDSKSRLIVKTETNTNATATYPVNVEKWEYDSTGALLSFSHDKYDNVTSALVEKLKISYEYEDNLLMFETNQYWDLVKNEWIQGFKFEYLYLDNDTKPDVKQFYQFINNQYVKINPKNEYFYTDTSFTEVFRQNANYFDRSVTTIKNGKQQEILVESVEYCPNLTIYKPRTRKETNYLTNGAVDKILEYETVNGCIVKDTIFKEVRKIIYGYKQEISSVEDKSDLMLDFRAFPNPATQTIHVSELGNNIHSIRIIDMKGSLIHYKETSSEHLMIERNGAPSGLYYLQIQTDKGIATKPIIWQD